MKTLLVQSPGHLYEVVPIFLRQIEHHKYFNKIVLVTDKDKPWGLTESVELVHLEKDRGRAANFRAGLERIDDEVFAMMCDDHVVTQSSLQLDRYFSIMNENPRLGRLQLSPPSSNYARYLRLRGRELVIADDSREWFPYQRTYRFYVNFQPSLWRKDYFSHCIDGNENRNKLELWAGKRARANREYVSGYIGQHAIRYENFLASCKVHHADPSFDRNKNVAHYREEFAQYALKHGTQLDHSKRVFVKRKEYSASVPLVEYMKHHSANDRLREYEVVDYTWRQKARTLTKKVRHGLGL